MTFNITNLLRPLFLLFLIFISYSAQAARINDYVAYKGTQEWKKALTVIREEIEDPLVDEDSYLSDINMLGIDALGNVASYYGYTADMDAEAKAYFRKARDTAGDDKVRVAQALHGLFNYYSKSNRNGLAIPLITQEMQLWQEEGDQYQVFISLDALASAYADMGEIDLRNYYRNKAFAIADEYFEFGEQPSDANEWLNYMRVLRKDVDNNVRIMPAAKMEEVWKKIEQITNEYVAPKTISYYGFAKLFALNGQDDRAQALMKQAVELYEEEKDEYPTLQAAMETDMACAQAQIHLEAGRYNKAADGFLDCRKRWQDIGKDMGGATWGLLGYAFEKAGKEDDALAAYETSIKNVEDTRSSFSVSQRATFFRNSVSRRPYWGAIRIHSRRAVNNNSPQEFSNALRSTERVRARQFGELLNQDVNQAIEDISLQAIRNKLPAKTLVLDYIFSDDSLIILAFNNKQSRARVVPYDGIVMRNAVRRISRQLALPNSDQQALQKDLLAVSKIVLEPVKDMIEGHSTIVVVPDGALNLVPFELLSINDKQYKPLIAYAAISNLPSLRLLATTTTARANGGIYAVADPIYPKPEDVLIVERDALEETTRNINLRGYFAPLPETRDEVQSIVNLFSKNNNTMALGENATETQVKTATLKDYRILHFATHGILGGEVPGVGEPALILGKDEYDDGFLRASEVEQLELDADLSVLSACNTGSGRLFSGEGVMGMSRSFMVAGSDSVIVSLWPVASKPTQDLMVRFYRHLQSGKSKSQSLRAAKLELKKTLPHPFYWSPFILVGQ